MSKDIDKLLQNVKEIAKIELAQPTENIDYEIIAKCFEKEPIYCYKEFVEASIIDQNKFCTRKMWDIFYNNGIGLINGYFDMMKIVVNGIAFYGIELNLMASLESCIYFIITFDCELLDHFIDLYEKIDTEYEFHLEPYIWEVIVNNCDNNTCLMHSELMRLLEILKQNNIPIQDTFSKNLLDEVRKIEEEYALTPSIFDCLPKFEVREVN